MPRGARSSRSGPREGGDDDPRRWPVRHATSYGGVVIRTGDDGAEVALIRTRNIKGQEAWTLPKGTAEEGEEPERAALREVQEETGLQAQIVAPLDEITYWFVWPPERARYRKTVRFFLMRSTGGDPALHDDEVEEVRFVPVAEAPRKVKHRTDRQVLERAAELVRTW